ncbi:Lsr2 family DNA-binding protein [Rhodococcus koreensis]
MADELDSLGPGLPSDEGGGEHGRGREIREWAIGEGLAVSSRGRIAARDRASLL